MTVKRLTRKPPTSYPNRKGPTVMDVQAADTPVRLIKDLNNGTVDPTPLSAKQRKAVLILTANGKRTSAELGILLGCPASSVRRLMSEIRREVGREVRTWSTEEVLGSMAMTAEKCSAMAMDQEDPQLAWAIERDKVKILQSLGVVTPDNPSDGVRVTIEALGNSYARATAILGKALDPRLTGRVEQEPEDVMVLATRTIDVPEDDG